jgi:AGZA family xanthine/uracil permease-like MFS transporter
MRWIVRGDIDGFFGLALDNLVQLLLIDSLCRFVLGFPPELVYGRVLPGAAISILLGNLFYAYQAKKLAERTGRTDVCALPYGINTVSLFAHVFLVMLPARVLAEKAGLPDPARVAWQAGLLATLCSGLMELMGALVAERVRKATPRAALLSTLAGIALGFISLGFFFRTFARPVVGLTTLGIVLLTYFGGVRFRGRIPGGMVAVGLGTLLAWTIGIAPVGDRPATPAFHIPVPVFGDLAAAIGGSHFLPYLSVIIAMGLFNVLGSLQNIESAEAAGDSYATRPALAVNGAGSIAAALFGSAFPTTIYIGHPGWKALGARAGYSVLNGTFVTVVCITGTLAWIPWAIPIDAGMAIG